jgi:NAD(P)-dependent dehydrogenase (short-subunit alcohol dehydrogenase family)
MSATASIAAYAPAAGFRLDDRIALITGAGSGTGLSIATEFARAGAEAVLIARTRDHLEAAAAQIREFGGRAHVRPCDITDSAAIGKIIDEFPDIDIVVNNAGTNVPEPFVDVCDEHLDALLRLNVRATFVVAQAVVKKMLAHPRRSDIAGNVINITSQMGRVGAPGRTAYCMTKHAIEGLTRAMAVELAPQNIRVNSIAPTFIDTPLIRRIVDTQDKQDYLLSRIPMGQMAAVGDVAAAAVFLASPVSAMTTGICLLVDGGWTAQ